MSNVKKESQHTSTASLTSIQCSYSFAAFLSSTRLQTLSPWAQRTEPYFLLPRPIKRLLQPTEPGWRVCDHTVIRDQQPSCSHGNGHFKTLCTKVESVQVTRASSFYDATDSSAALWLPTVAQDGIFRLIVSAFTFIRHSVHFQNCSFLHRWTVIWVSRVLRRMERGEMNAVHNALFSPSSCSWFWPQASGHTCGALIGALLQPCSAWERAWERALDAPQTSPDKITEV